MIRPAVLDYFVLLVPKNFLSIMKLGKWTKNFTEDFDRYHTTVLYTLRVHPSSVHTFLCLSETMYQGNTL